MSIRIIALLAGMLPIVAVNITYLMAAYLNHVPDCIPYLDGCASISATGRNNPEALFFKGVMIPVAILMMMYWKLVSEWLVQLQGNRTRLNTVIQVLGITAAIFLVIYTVALGEAGKHYQIQRRIGVTIYFSFTLLAELLFTNRLWKLVTREGLELGGNYHQWKLVICIFMVILGLISIPVPILSADPDYWENVLEWNFAVAMYAFMIVTYFAWKKTGFTARFSIRKASE